MDTSTAQKKGGEIVAHVKKLIEKAATNKNEHFYLNRFVHQRLALVERKEKKPIKDQLLKDNPQCNYCGTPKGLELHRIDSLRGYEKNNCVLTCRKCHQQNKKTLEPNFDNASSARPKSISGKHKTIRQLVEDLLDKNPEVTYEKMESAVLKEFPTSAFKKTHYNWYMNKIIMNGEWKYYE